jgi:hypothetical protein
MPVFLIILVGSRKELLSWRQYNPVYVLVKPCVCYTSYILENCLLRNVRVIVSKAIAGLSPLQE